MRRVPVRALAAFVSLLVVVTLAPAAMAEDVDPSQIFFPVQEQDSLQYSDNWGDCRSGCSRRHLGVDMMSDQMTPVFAAQNGTIYDYRAYCNDGGTYCSYYLLLDGDDGRMYFYVHLNEDTPGRPNGCDHAGGYSNAVSPRLYEAYEQGNLKGLRVERGEHLGYVGSSGNAGCRVDHLHFEIWHGEGWTGHGEGQGSINPYPPTKAAQDARNVWGPEWTSTPPVPAHRVAGADRIETAVKLSQQAYPDGADTIVLAPATSYQEALVAAPLAATVDAPVLLAWPEDNDTRDAVPDLLATEVDRLGAQYAIVVGAPRRIGNNVVDQLVAKTEIAIEDVERIGDPDPGAMSAKVAEFVLASHGITVPPPPAEEDADKSSATREGGEESDESGGEESDESAGDLIPPLKFAAPARTAAAADDEPAPIDPLLAAGVHPEGLGWPDALAASVLGSRQRSPVLLTPYGNLHADVARVLSSDGIGAVRITGGEHAVSARAARQVEESGREVVRLAGADRYGTAQAVAAAILDDGATLTTLAVATGGNFPDALASGPALALLDRAFILLPTRELLPHVQDWITGHAAGIDDLEVIGGYRAVAEEIVRQAAVAANTDAE